MKKELILEELTLDQKLGMVLCTNLSAEATDEGIARILNMIREHRLGAVYVGTKRREEFLKLVHETADYPILTVTGNEAGIEPHVYPSVRALGASGYDEKAAYTFGKILGHDWRAIGVNVVNSPVVDISNVNMRHIGSDPEGVARMAVAIVRGMHDAGVLSMVKHYPGPGEVWVDTHMQEGRNDRTPEELESINLRPYLRLLEEGLLDGIMPGHNVITAIDPDRPASLSKKVMDLLRDRGFDGISMTDALSMMGVALKYGKEAPNGMCIAAGNDFALPWDVSCETGFAYLKNGFEKGLFTEEQLDASVRRVLAAQHKVNLLSDVQCELTEEDLARFEAVTRDCVSAHYADGVPHAIPKDGRHLFVILSERNVHNEQELAGAVPFANEWFYPLRIRDMILEKFPNSDCTLLNEYPTAGDNIRLFDKQIPYDDVIYITSHRAQAYLGRDCLTERVLAVMRALQSTNRISAILHFGNPHVMDDVPRCDRFILGYTSEKCVEFALSVLAGDAVATGMIPYENVQIRV
ncbi:MAG: hypothetical protein J6T24_05100 [Clostridia bacterium]|nr:hypothetical protein [Clostridia bacterium]